MGREEVCVGGKLGLSEWQQHHRDRERQSPETSKQSKARQLDRLHTRMHSASPHDALVVV